MSLTSDHAYLVGTFNRGAKYVPYMSIVSHLSTTSIYQDIKFNDAITAIASDHQGGWYLGGNFNKAGQADRNKLARINSGGALDALWMPANLIGTVSCIAFDGVSVFVGGSFVDTQDGIGVTNLAAFNGTTGARLPWSPNPNGSVTDIVVSSNRLFVAGTFNHIANQPRNGLASFELSTRTLTAWNLNLLGYYTEDLVVDGEYLYAAGCCYSATNMSSRSIIRAGVSTGLDINWNTSISNVVSKIAVATNRLYAVGQFTSVMGNTNVKYAARFDKNTAALDAWVPIVPGIGEGVMISGSNVAIYGSLPNSVIQKYIVGFDDITGSTTQFSMYADGPIYAAVSGVSNFVGSSGSHVGNFIE